MLPSVLTDPQADEVRELLAADRQRLLAAAHAAVGLSMDRDRDRIGRDPMDEAMEEQVVGTELRLHDRETFLLGKIDAALARLAEGTIDTCEDCDGPIGFARLKARPVTTLCIACKEAAEEHEPAG
jgi:DnaK suppressor protein